MAFRDKVKGPFGWILGIVGALALLLGSFFAGMATADTSTDHEQASVTGQQEDVNGQNTEDQNSEDQNSEDQNAEDRNAEDRTDSGSQNPDRDHHGKPDRGSKFDDDDVDNDSNSPDQKADDGADQKADDNEDDREGRPEKGDRDGDRHMRGDLDGDRGSDRGDGDHLKDDEDGSAEETPGREQDGQDTPAA